MTVVVLVLDVLEKTFPACYKLGKNAVYDSILRSVRFPTIRPDETYQHRYQAVG